MKSEYILHVESIEYRCLGKYVTLYSEGCPVTRCFGIPAAPASILHKSIAGRYRPVRVADGPITARCRFIKNASWDVLRQIAKLKQEVTGHRTRLYLGRVERKIAFEHAQSAQILIILHMRKVSSGLLLFINTVFFNEEQKPRWYNIYTDAQVDDINGCAGWSRPSLSAYARRHVVTAHLYLQRSLRTSSKS